ncbi:YgjV family protein [Thalassotalea sp. PLHSN55]|uniref:YgjV family protein n=1 Tax=Thalassotalea sp. PLHSN55 TaxID=3435888 RepID=UPI003F85B355
MEFYIAQALGLFSFILGGYTFFQKSDARLKFSMLCLFACQSLHFFLLGASVAAAANILNFLRTFIAIKYNSPRIGLLFIAANIIWGSYLYQSPISILPILGAGLGTFAVFFLQGIKMRLAFITGAVCWITHNIVVQSVGGVLLESVVIIANVITICRLYCQQKEELLRHDK